MISYNVISYSSKSLVKVKVFFASLTEDIVEEELAYTVSKKNNKFNVFWHFMFLSFNHVFILLAV